MRVLLDECLPRRLARLIVGHEIATVQQAGYAGLTNGALLRRIDGVFDAFITIDQNLPAQNQTTRYRFGFVLLRARSNRLDELAPLAPQIIAALDTLRAGELVFVGSET